MTRPKSATLDRIPDAGGITGRVSGVVDVLTAADVVATGESIVQIPVDKIEPHPHNRKIADADVADIVAGLKAGEPIINALGVTAAADWNATKPEGLKEIAPGHFIITAGGHRRLRAAELAGLKTVPCVIRAGFAGAEGRRAALLENLQRQDLDPFQEAEAFAELVNEPYKLSQRDLASTVGCNQSHISKRLKLLKLPSTVVESVRIGKMQIADAVELARIADQGPIFDDALNRLNRSGSWYTAKRAVDDAIAEHEARTAVRKAEEKLAELGLRRITRHPDFYAYSTTEPVSLEGLKVDEDKHATEPCHVGYINTHGEIVLACDKPAEHMPGGSSTLKLRRSIADRLKNDGRAVNRDQVEGDKLRRQLRKTQAARFECARSFLLPLSVDPSIEQELVDRATIGHVFHRPGSANDVAKCVIGILGLATPKGTAPATQVEELQRKSRNDLATVEHSTLALVVAAAYFEARLMSSWVKWDDDHRWWYELLEQNGYAISEIEGKKLSKIPAAGGVESTPEEEDVPRSCVKCGCTDVEACDGGCTWVAENLCSTCADALDAGFVDDHEQLLEASEAIV